MTDARLSTLTVEAVNLGSVGARAQISSLVVEAVLAAIAGYARVSDLALETIHGGTSGARANISALDVESVYTTGAPNDLRQRAWSFTWDGHKCYALDLGTNGTVVYDFTTGEWSRFNTSGFGGHWNMKNGFDWRAARKTVAGDTSTGKLYAMDPTSFFDDGWRPSVYEVNGVLFATDIGYHKQYALRMLGSTGRNADDEAPVLKMVFSDDNGATWSNEYSVALTADSKARIEFRSLGSFTAPGRIFRLYDTGGLKFIGMVVADMEGEGGTRSAAKP